MSYFSWRILVPHTTVELRNFLIFCGYIVVTAVSTSGIHYGAALPPWRYERRGGGSWLKLEARCSSYRLTIRATCEGFGFFMRHCLVKLDHSLIMTARKSAGKTTPVKFNKLYANPSLNCVHDPHYKQHLGSSSGSECSSRAHSHLRAC